MLVDENSKRLFVSSRCSQTIYAQRINLARMAIARGWKVELGGELVPGHYEDKLAKMDLTFHPLPVNQKSLNPFNILNLIRAYRSTLIKTKPDVFHAFTIKPHIAGLIGAKLAGVKLRFATVAGLGHVFISSSRYVRLFSVLLLRLAFHFANLVFFYNKADRDFYVRKRIVPISKTKLINGSGIETDYFYYSALPDTRQISFVFVGRLLVEKGVNELFEAMHLVLNQYPDAQLHLIGTCDTHNPTAISVERVKELAKGGLFTWHGMVNDVRPVVRDCHVVVLPSYREGIPLALLEGAAMGRALIATDVPGCQDVVTAGVTGLLVPPADSFALAAAMITLASDRDLVTKMGIAARQDVIARFDTKVVNAQVIKIYEEALASLNQKNGHP
jgi:glycosyltransferase involved in cell wall biosynthesis